MSFLQRNHNNDRSKVSVTIEPKLEIDVPLLRKTLEHITAHPEEHQQGVWGARFLMTACGTAFCLAGHAVQFAGHEIEWDGDDIACDVVGGASIEFTAQRELGLEDRQADVLFNPFNTQRDLWRLASEYTHGAIEVPAAFL